MSRHKWIGLAILSLFAFGSFSHVFSQAAVADIGVSRVFYGYAPTIAWIRVMGVTDATAVKVFDITDADRTSLLTEFSVGMGDVVEAKVSEEHYYKIVADKEVIALLYGGGVVDTFSFGTYFPSLDGSLVGKNFIFESAIAGINTGLSWINIFAYEDVVVEFENSTTSFAIPLPGLTSFQIAGFKSWDPIKLTSTGKIDVRYLGNGTVDFAAVPTPEGNYVGMVHYVVPWYENCFTLITFAAGTVGIIDVNTDELVSSKSFNEAGIWQMNLSSPEYYGRGYGFEGTVDSVLVVGESQLGGQITDPRSWSDGVTFLGGKYGELNEYFVWAGSEVVLFAAEETSVSINGTDYSLDADDHARLIGGRTHHITSDKPLVIQLDTTGLDQWGSYMMAVTGMPVAEPQIEEGISTTHYIIAVAFAAAAIVIVIFKKKRT